MTVETLDDFEPGKSGIVRRWLDELGIAGKWQRDWEQRSIEVIKRYSGETPTAFNILHSNVEILRPNLFANKPEPDVRKRINSSGGPAREAAEVVERSVRYMNDTHPYEDNMGAAVNDYILTGRAVARVYYKPTIVQRNEPVFELDEGVFFTQGGNALPEDAEIIRDAEGQTSIQLEELQFERADISHVPYDDFRHHPAKVWSDVRWVAFRHLFTRDGMDRSFGKAESAATSLTVEDGNQATNESIQKNPELFRRAEVWEIWDKEESKILFISPGNVETPLLEVDDGPEYYNLGGFFPTPEPLRSIRTPNTLLPTPEFTIYQELANELDDITIRITEIVKAIDVRGVYDASMPELGGILDSPNKLFPIEDWPSHQDGGGLGNMMDFIDTDPQVKAFIALVQQRDQLIQTIYQTIGLSDLTRGASDPRETATAQRLKGQFGSMRLAPRQKEWERYQRDLMRIQAELMAEKFEPTTLQIMSGIEMTEEIMMLLRNDALRNFAIDIETDSTIAIDQARQQEELKEMVETLAATGQAVAMLPEGARGPFIRSVVRKLGLGRDVEIAIEESEQEEPKPDPEAQAAQAALQLQAKEVENKDIDSQRKFALGQEKNANDAQKIAIEADKNEAEVIQGAFNNAN